MRESENLFQLIKSLNQAEKAYFKKYTSMHIMGDENNYIKLFNIISRQETYNESKIKKALKNSTVIKYLPSSKIYLYKLILKCLRAYHSDESTESRILELIRDSSILKDKGLVNQSYKMLKKAKQLAEEKEEFSFYMKISERMQKYRRRKSDSFDSDRSFHETEYLKNLHILEKMIEGNELNRMASLTYSLYLRGSEKKAQEEAKKLLKEPILQENRKYLSKESLLKALQMKTNLYSILGDFNSNKRMIEKQIEIVESHPLFQKDYFFTYAILLSSLLIAYHKLGLVSEARKLFTKIQSFKLNNPYEELTLFSYAYVNILNIFPSFGLVEEAYKLLPYIQEKLEEFKEKISIELQLTFYLNIAGTYFFYGEYTNALRWNNLLIKDPHREVRRDINNGGRMLNILIHFELGNYELLESLVGSIQRSLKKEAETNNFLEITSRYIKRIIRITEKEAMHKELVSFRKECLDEMENAKEDAYDLLPWIESKLYNRPILELMKERTKRIYE